MTLKHWFFTFFCPFTWFCDPYCGPCVSVVSVKTLPYLLLHLSNINSTFTTINTVLEATAAKMGKKRMTNWSKDGALIHSCIFTKQGPTDPTLSKDILNMKLWPLYHRYSFQKATVFIGQLQIYTHTLYTHLFQSDTGLLTPVVSRA